MLQVLEKLSLNPKRLFLIDGLGAALTACSLVAIRTLLNAYVGMPPSILKILATMASIFAIYSISCFLFVARKWSAFLTIISLANIIYVCLTTYFIITNFSQLTTLGLFYFLLEIVIISGLAMVEIKAAVNERRVLQ